MEKSRSASAPRFVSFALNLSGRNKIQAMHNLGFLEGCSGSVSLYVVLRAGHAQFEIFAGFSRVFFTLCSTRSGPCVIWDVWQSFRVLFHFI